MAKNEVKDNLNIPYGLKPGKSGKAFPKNLILYGPPGTGKTFHMVNYALAIIEGKTLEVVGKEARENLISRFQIYKEKQEIEFITFHQSYGYEDFIQGLRPNTQAGNLLFEKRDGVFKRIADRAKKNYDNYTLQQTKPKIPFEDLLNLLLSKNINPETEEIEIPLEISHRIYQSVVIYDITEDALIYRRRTKHNVVKEEDRKLTFTKLTALYEGQDIKEAINEKYYQAVVEAVKKHEEEIAQEEEELHDLKNYVLVIDEINRANISNVFGELITLIEEDKRYKASNALSITLPSGDVFCVPPNLYILGTMNTTDKSIALLDIALRRRFIFKGVYPDEGLIQDVFLKKVFRKLNQALLKEKKSPDFLIGHAFFIQKKQEDLKEILEEQIFPLLKEYFLHREDKILKILKESEIQVVEENYQLKYIG